MAELADERHLVLLAQCGDREAIEQIPLGLRHSSSRYVRSLVGESACEDVLLDVFVKIWRNLKSLEKPDLLRPWVYRIASRACFAHLRRRQRWPERFGDGTDVEDLPSTSVSGPPELIAGLEALIEDVPPASRAVLAAALRAGPVDRGGVGDPEYQHRNGEVAASVWAHMPSKTYWKERGLEWWNRRPKLSAKR
jgi:DNA-directed RNA polymerase specialized sigma24 family protein